MNIALNRIISRILLSVLALVTAAVAAEPASAPSDQGHVGRTVDWPQYRGPESDGISGETGWTWKWGADGPKVLWRASVGVGFSSFAVAAGRVYTMGNSQNSDTVFCFDAGTGKVLWRHSYACDAQPLSYEGGPCRTSESA